MDTTPRFWAYIIRLLLKLLDEEGRLTSETAKHQLEICQRIESGELTYDEFKTLNVHFFTQQIQPTDKWNLTRLFQSNQLDTFFLYVMSAENLGQALSDIDTFQKLYFAGDNQFSYESAGQRTICKLTLKPDLSLFASTLFDILLVFFFYLCRTITNNKFDAHSITLPINHRENDSHDISTLTSANVKLEGADYIVEFDTRWLDKASFFSNIEIRTSLAKTLKNELSARQQNQPIGSQIIAQLKAHHQPSKLTFEQVCEQLSLSEAQLRRKLAKENTSFKQIAKYFLFERATKQLISTNIKIDAVALELGYSERAAFERAFKSYYGITPSGFRTFGKKLGFKDQKSFFHTATEKLPPVSKHCRELLNLSSEQLTVSKVVNIVQEDPIFTGRIMGLASKAIYGSPAKNITEAIGKTLGVEAVRNLAAIFVAKDQLGDFINGINVNKLISAMIISNKVFQQLQQEQAAKIPPADLISNQVCSFGLLGLFLLFHKENQLRLALIEQFEQNNSFFEYCQKLTRYYGVPLYRISSLMLASWGLPHDVVKETIKLQQELEKPKKAINQEQLILLSHALAIAASFQEELPESLSPLINKFEGTQNINDLFIELKASSDSISALI